MSAVDENTPLTSNGPLSPTTPPATISPSSSFFGRFFTPGKLTAVVNETAETRLFSDLAEQAKNGDVSIRLIALLGGLALIVTAIIEVLPKLFTLNVAGTFIELYTLIIGFVVILLEGKSQGIDVSKILPETAIVRLYKYGLFLKFVWGRGCLYFVAGTLIFTQGSLLDWISGAYMMVVGVIYLYAGNRTVNKLQELRKALYSEDTLKSKFDEADTDGKGSLAFEQFVLLCQSLGMDLNRRESDAAFVHIDKSSDELLTYDEFAGWWNSWTDNDAIQGGEAYGVTFV